METVRIYGDAQCESMAGLLRNMKDTVHSKKIRTKRVWNGVKRG